ncbi:MAG: DedA family protein [Bdellovibrionales bacterium]|nr:DedA family protein [Bdellovibrionales bacterium]
MDILKSLNPIFQLRRLYDWTLKWADHPNSIVFLGLLSAVEGIFFPVPVDPFLLAMGASKPKKAILFALVATLTSVLGGAIGYALGFWFWEATSHIFYTYVFAPDKFQLVIDKFNDNAFLAIFLAGFTPIPYKVFAIASGVAKISLFDFVFGSLLGRSLRFMIFGVSLYLWGPTIRNYIEKNFDRLTILLGVMATAVIAYIKLA